MSLRDRLIKADKAATSGSKELFERFGVLGNPFPASSQTTNNPHLVGEADRIIDEKVEAFIRDHTSQVVVIEGTQGTGKTNYLNHYEKEITDVASELSGFYVVRYLADPEASFEGTVRRLIQELGTDHIIKLAEALTEDQSAINQARSVELRSALRRLAMADTEDLDETAEAFIDWLLGIRILKSHRQLLRVNFRLDTVEAKTAALRDIIVVSSEAGILNGVFLLLDELEKQDGILSATAIVRYLSALRALIDSLPNHLFMMLAITPDALRRYGVALPAFRSRLNDRITLEGLQDEEEALDLARFYLATARREGELKHGPAPRRAATIVSDDEIRKIFSSLYEAATKAGDTGLRQRSFLHNLHIRAEKKIQATD
jgi:hypothetical protein